MSRKNQTAAEEAMPEETPVLIYPPAEKEKTVDELREEFLAREAEAAKKWMGPSEYAATQNFEHNAMPEIE